MPLNYKQKKENQICFNYWSMTYASFVSIIGDSGQQPSKNVAGFILR